MEIKIKSYSSQTSLLSSIICFLIGGIFFTNAEIVLNFTSITIGILLSIIGLISLITYYINYKKGLKLTGNLILSITTILLAIVFLAFQTIVEILLGLTIGGWILLLGILRLIGAIKLKFKTKRFIVNLLISLILIGLGIYTIASGSLIIETAGILIMISSGTEIIGYIINNKLDSIEDNQQNETSDDIVLTIPKLENKEEKIKETIEEPKLISEESVEKKSKKRRGRKKKIKDIEAK